MAIEDLLYNFDNMLREENIFLELLILVEFQSYVQEVWKFEYWLAYYGTHLKLDIRTLGNT